jgi:hypothetical protein
MLGLFFLRQISILKQANKLNYTPIIVAVGVLGTIVHFILHPESKDFILLLRESMFPMLLAMFLYIIMNIIHQTQLSQYSQGEEQFIQQMANEITNLKEFISGLEKRMILSTQDETVAQEEIRQKFKEDIKALESIKLNQDIFLKKFDELAGWHNDITEGFKYFKDVQMPQLDSVVHKHIDILRVAEQEHYNQLKVTLESAVENRYDITEELGILKESLVNINNIYDDISKTITKKTLEQLSVITGSFETQIKTLKSHAEGINTSLHEDENRLLKIRQQSEIIMKQMVLSSSKMQELSDQSSSLTNVYAGMQEFMKDVNAVKSDYVKAQSELSMISREIKNSQNEQIENLEKQVWHLSESLTQKIDDSLKKLHEHYHIADEDISKSVQLLAKRAQFKNGYSNQN